MSQQNTTYYPVLRSAALALGGGIAFSWPLWWTSARATDLPATPLFSALPFSPVLDAVLIITLMVALTWTVFQPGQSRVRTWVVISMLLLAVADLGRCQPWVWLFFLVFLINFPVPSTSNNLNMATLRWLLASVYCWSGVYKISPWFARDNFEWFCSAYDWTVQFGKMSAIGYGLAIAESLMGMALLVPRLAVTARWGLMVMHVVIVLFLLKLDWNPVVIPWNMGMVALLYFLNNEQKTIEKWPLTNRIFALAFFVLPALNIVGWWPRPFSWHLYDNTQPEVVFFTENARFDPLFQSKIWSEHAFDQQRQLLLDDWAVEELHVPLPDMKLVTDNLGRHLCQRLATKEYAGWSVLFVQQFNQKQTTTDTIWCQQ